jgi:hypothetical protein
MEKIIRRRKDELQLCYSLANSFLVDGIGCKCRDNALVFICASLPYRPALEHFECSGCLDALFSLLRVCCFYQLDESDTEDPPHPPIPPPLSSASTPPPRQGSSDVRSVSPTPRYIYTWPALTSVDKIVEIRDYILTSILVYLRVRAFMDLERSRPESVSAMCGGTMPGVGVVHVDQNVDYFNQDSLHHRNRPPPHLVSPDPLQYSPVSFDGLEVCTDTADALLHSIREHMLDYNDIPTSSPPSPVESERVSTPSFRRSSQGVHNRVPLAWCVPFSFPSFPSGKSPSSASPTAVHR